MPAKASLSNGPVGLSEALSWRRSPRWMVRTILLTAAVVACSQSSWAEGDVESVSWPPAAPPSPVKPERMGRKPASLGRPAQQPTIQQSIEKAKPKAKPKAEPKAEPKPELTQEVSTPASEPEGSKFDDTLTGNWGGNRDSLSARGIEFEFVYKGELSRTSGGGSVIRNHNLENLDIRMKLDGDALFGAKGLSFFFYGLADKGASAGNSPAASTGARQGVSNIEAPTDDIKLYEAWVQQVFFEDRASILFGLHDLNSEFYSTASSLLFLNPSFGIGQELAQTGPQGPSIFPFTAPSLRLRVEPTKSSYFQVAAFGASAGDPQAKRGLHIRASGNDGFLLITEAGITSSDETRPAKYAIGTWAYTRTFDHLSSTVTDSSGATVAQQVSSNGAYVLIDHSFSNDFSAFIRHGAASTGSNAVQTNTSVGVLLKRPFNREADSVGLGATRVTPSDSFSASRRTAGNETKRNQTKL